MDVPQMLSVQSFEDEKLHIQTEAWLVTVEASMGLAIVLNPLFHWAKKNVDTRENPKWKWKVQHFEVYFVYCNFCTY